MRDIKHLVVHCTATLQTATPDSISKYWREQLGWKSPGYHILVKPDGECVRMAPDEAVTNGVGGGYNANSLHVSYIGGILPGNKPVDNRTPEQKSALIEVLKEWKAAHPDAEILGHRDFWFKYRYDKARKACPCFDAITEYSNL